MDERVVLKNGTKYEFKNEDEIVSYEISKCIGKGGSSVVYEVRCNEYEIGRLKEFYPVDINIKRDENGSLLVEESDLKSFEERKQLFENILKKRAELLEINVDIANTMPEFCQLVRGRNTSYIFQSFTNGKCYSDIYGESLEHIIKTAIGLVKALKCYHDIGYVHLDIKLENMLVINEGKNIKVQLFDYETVTSISDLKSGKIGYLPYTEQYSAPEHIKKEYNKIDIRSDVFSVGIVLFKKIMGRFPSQKNRELAHNACYDYDVNSELFDGVPLIIQKYLDNLFEHTIRVSEAFRYSDDEKFIAMLEKLLSFTQKGNRIVQKNNFYSNIEEFFGRINELKSINEVLQEKNLILLYGMGGIGKSELVRKYLTENEEQYSKIIYIEETGNSIRETINNDENLKIEGLYHFEGLSADDYFDNKVEAIHSECELAKEEKKNVIIVFDNTEFFVELVYLNKLRDAGCKIIVVSRDPWDGIAFDKKIEINRIGNKDDELSLFLSYMDVSGLDKTESEAVDKIIEHYDGHPLLLELIAKAMNSSGKLPSEMLNEINEKGIGSSGEEEIRYIENGYIKQERIENIVYSLFDSGDFSPEEIRSLQFMSLISADGIEKAETRKFIGDLKAINSLIGKGFIRLNNGKFSIHPIIKEMIEKEEKYRPQEEDLKGYKNVVFENISGSEKYALLSYKQILLYTCIGNSIDLLININDAEFYTAMGNAYQRVGQGDKANAYFKKSLDLSEQRYGENDEHVAIANMRYGQSLRKNGYYEKSKAYLDKSAEFYKLLVPLVGIGTMLPSRMPFFGGMIAGAVIGKTFGRRLFSAHTKKNGYNEVNAKSDIEINYDKSLDAAKVYNQLAKWYCEQGDCENALLYCQKAYDIAFEKAETYKRAKTKLYYIADTMAGIKYESAEYEEALNYYQESLDLKQELYSKETIYYMHSYLGVAKCKYMLNEFQEALKWIIKAMDLAEHMKGSDSIDTAKVYYIAAKIYQELGGNKEATMYYDQALQVEERILGKTNSFTLLVAVDYMYYRCVNLGITIMNDDYLEMVDKIKTKTRPHTASFQQMYKKLDKIAEMNNFDKVV